jgi:hypothetical protein
MRAIVIDSMMQTVKEADLSKEGTLTQMQTLVGGYIERAMTLPNGDDVFVNMEGLLHSPRHFFTIVGGHQPFAGNAVILNSNEDGDSTAAKSDLVYITTSVKFMTLEEVCALYR